MNLSERPVFLLGNGARGCNVARLLTLGVPVLTSWQAKDMVDNHHPLYFGSPGIYGQRAANKVLHEADTIIAIGNRMAIWNVGYEGPRADQRVIMCDVDKDEAAKFPNAERVDMYAAEFIDHLDEADFPQWVTQCSTWNKQYPWVESPAHDDAGGYINSYRFVDALHEHLRPDEVIVTDMGTAHICANQVLRLKPPQRLISSGGLGEMGCGLPMAIGASFSRFKGEVLCLVGDGGMMMNLQELQTIAQHQLRVKIIVFSNDGYLMIKHTQKVAGAPYSAVNAATGVSCPSFVSVAQAFGMPACDVRTWDHFNRAIPQLFYARGPALVEFHMHPEQPLVPKLNPIFIDGKPTSPRFDQMSPLL